MTAIYTEPKEVNLRQLETELGINGLHVSNIGDTTMLVEADVDEEVLAEGVENHTADPTYKHPDDAKREAGAKAEATKKDAARKSAVAKLKAIGLTDEEIAAL